MPTWDSITVPASMVLITGNTYPVKDRLKALGARWDAERGGWQVPSDKADEARQIVRDDAQGQKKMNLWDDMEYERNRWNLPRSNTSRGSAQTSSQIDSKEMDTAVSDELAKTRQNLERYLDKANRTIAYLEQENRRLRREVDGLPAIILTDTQSFAAIIKQWYRDMSRVCHPDAGGSDENQAVLNLCYEELKRRLESARQKDEKK